MKLALIAAALAGAHAFGEYKDEKKPFAVTIHGAGFRSVLEGAAVARALDGGLVPALRLCRRAAGERVLPVSVRVRCHGSLAADLRRGAVGSGAQIKFRGIASD